MNHDTSEQKVSQLWEALYQEALFEVDAEKMQRRIELAKHAIFDRMEDLTCARTEECFQPGELAALRNAHHALRALEQLYLTNESGNLAA